MSESMTAPPSSHLTLQGCQDVRTAAELHRKLMELLCVDNPAAVVHCDNLHSMDASTIQLLLAAKREHGTDLTLEMSPESDCFRWVQLAGVANRLVATSASLTASR